MAKRGRSDSEGDTYSDYSFDEIELSEDDSCEEGDVEEEEQDDSLLEDSTAVNETGDERLQQKVTNEINPKLTSGNVAHIEDYDSSDEEDLRNTIGNIPVEWYRDYSHIGYDLEGKKVMKAKGKDEVEEFLTQMDNPYYWRTVKDKMTSQNVVLTDRDIEIIQRITKSRYADCNYNAYEPFSDFFTYETMIHPVTNRPETKASFIPSIGEKRAISRLVFRIKRARNLNIPRVQKPKDDRFNFSYDLWSNANQPNKRMLRYIPAPKMKPPTHEESYNPPPEYLLTEKEQEDWNNTEPEMRKLNFIPQKYEKLRQVPSYSNFVRERFERCLDLYMCPRVRKMRANVDPEHLIPELPKPRDLQPFPTQLSIVYEGHTKAVRCLSVEPKGQYFASGSDDCTVKIWEILTARCVKTIQFEFEISCISWCPEPSKSLCLVAVGKDLYIINPGIANRSVASKTDLVFKEYGCNNEEASTSSKDESVRWEVINENNDEKLWKKGMRAVLKHRFEIKQILWHFRGDYFSAVMPKGGHQAVVIHQLSKLRSQVPFKKSKGLIQCVSFHPSKSFLFVATQRYVRIYNLVKQELIKKLMCNCKQVSSMAIHPAGDNLIIGSYDLRLSWFDLDLSNKPYKTLRYHKKAIRQVVFHPKYPLFASASDDGSVVVTHSMVYNDLTQNALIVPVKLLRTNTKSAIFDCCFHPCQPWIFCCGMEPTIRLFT